MRPFFSVDPDQRRRMGRRSDLVRPAVLMHTVLLMGLGMAAGVGETTGSGTATAGDPPTNPPAVAEGTDSIQTDATKRVRRRRSARRSPQPVVSRERERKRVRQARQSRQPRPIDRSPDAQNRLHLDGSVELSLGDGRVFRARGTATIELDEAAAEKLVTSLSQNLHEVAAISDSLAKAIQAMPATLSATNEILKTLSNPETQNAIRQGEQMLRSFLPSAPLSEPVSPPRGGTPD